MFGINLDDQLQQISQPYDSAVVKFFLTKKNVALCGEESESPRFLAKSVAKDLRDDGYNIIWIDGSSVGSTRNYFTLLSQKLGLPDNPFQIFDYFSGKNTLYVFDDVSPANGNFKEIEAHIIKDFSKTKFLLISKYYPWNSSEFASILVKNNKIVSLPRDIFENKHQNGLFRN